jgi:hypothetical protein
MNAVSQKDRRFKKKKACDNGYHDEVYRPLDSRSFGVTMGSNARGVFGGSITAGIFGG